MVRRAAPKLTEGRVPDIQLRSVAMSLLEVVADDLVDLDEVVGREPAGEALVQLGSGRLRQRLVGGVPDQQVAEAVGGLPGLTVAGKFFVQGVGGGGF